MTQVRINDQLHDRIKELANDLNLSLIETYGILTVYALDNIDKITSNHNLGNLLMKYRNQEFLK